jgi:hypothetical protein
MKETIEVLMLPTKNKSRITFDGAKVTFHNHKVWNRKMETPSMQNLYITISQKVKDIKIGDWCLLFDSYGTVMSNPLQWLGHGTLNDGVMKIIASTDVELIIDVSTKGQKESYIKEWICVPQVQKSFLKEYAADPDKKWKVEYNPICCGNYISCNSNCTIKGFKLKLNQDNEVTITSVEEKMYSREDRRQAVRDFHQIVYNDWDEEDVENWIEKNL